ncbi:uncharacterized protein LOC114458764 [Gouania willdenowi]|uniref:uncharacterized protein LOC114458764 n=1 Tax=Gouania willdenowi TaxID=441366 RepID=UPI0010542106|nr:uncharacterized protein LOC114458764 [Gouania willdenowi]
MLSQDLNVEVGADEFNDIQNSIIDWDDSTWYPDKESESLSSSEEDVTREVDSDDDSEESTYKPRICVRTGGALNSKICLDALPTISMEDTVHDVSANIPDPTDTDLHTFPESCKVMVEDDIIGHPASITYHDSLKQLAEYLCLPVNTCPGKDSKTKQKCMETGPDAHTQISALFSKGKYKDIGVQHTLDIWHGSKSLSWAAKGVHHSADLEQGYL